MAQYTLEHNYYSQHPILLNNVKINNIQFDHYYNRVSNTLALIKVILSEHYQFYQDQSIYTFNYVSWQNIIFILHYITDINCLIVFLLIGILKFLN